MKKQIICLVLALLALRGGLPVFAAPAEGLERREEIFLEYESAASAGEESLACLLYTSPRRCRAAC